MSEEKKVEKIEIPDGEIKKPDDLKSLVEKSIKWTEVVYEQNKKIKYRLNLIIWGGILKWLIILVPTILGIVYLVPLLTPYWKEYSGLLSGTNNGAVKTEQLNNVLQGVSSSQLQEIMKSLNK